MRQPSRERAPMVLPPCKPGLIRSPLERLWRRLPGTGARAWLAQIGLRSLAVRRVYAFRPRRPPFDAPRQQLILLRDPQKTVPVQPRPHLLRSLTELAGLLAVSRRAGDGFVGHDGEFITGSAQYHGNFLQKPTFRVCPCLSAASADRSDSIEPAT
jgi:hypothetical protein